MGATIDDVMAKLNYFEPKLDKLDTIESQIFEITTKCASIEQRQSALENTTEANCSDIEALQESHDSLQAIVNKLQYEKIQNNIVIYGIPVESDENIQVTALTICNKFLNTPITEDSIFSRRMFIRTTAPPIVVCFKNLYTKIALLKNWKDAKKSQPQLQQQLKNQFNSPLNIVVTEEQTELTLKLFKETKFALARKFKYIWIRHGNIYIRQSETALVHKIATKFQLQEFVNFQEDPSPTNNTSINQVVQELSNQEST